MKLKKLLAIILTVTLASLTLTSIASAQPATLTTTVPVFGTDLIIEIVTDADGNFDSATIAAVDTTNAEAVAIATDLVQSTSTEHGGFEVKFHNSADGIEIEVNVVDSVITKTEVETTIVTPGVNGGPGVWIGDPLGNGDTITVNYDVTVDDTGTVGIEATSTVVGTNTFLDAGVFATRSHEGETEATFTFFVWDGGIVDDKGTPDDLSDDAIVPDSQNSTDLVIKVEVEHGRLEVKVGVSDPNERHGDDDDHESDDHESDDHESDDDHGDDDHGDDDDDDEGHDRGHDDDDEGHGGSHDEDDD